MAADPREFGTLADGRVVRSLRLEWPAGLAVELLEFGAVVRSLTAPVAGGRMEALLGFERLADYEADETYQGCIVGRFANRIAGAAFTLDGEAYAVTANEGPNTLHGGRLGLSKRLWRFEPPGADGLSAALAYVSPDGEEGFPGRLDVRVAFTLTAADTLRIVWEARTDRPTPVNLTHHLYFNLSGDRQRPTLDHTLAVAAQAFTPVRPDLIPTGALVPVAGGPFDLRTPRRLGAVLAQKDAQLEIGGGVDHNWGLDRTASPAARLRSPETGLALDLATDQPGLQVYTGQGLSGRFARFGGIALEPQGFPDAVNQPGFPDCILRPGVLYRRTASYRFQATPPGEAS